MKIRIFIIVLTFISIFTLGSAICDQQIKSVSQIINQNGKAVVFIASLDSQNQIRSTGSGFIVRNNGVILTNYHVVEDSYPAFVKLSNGNIYDDISIINVDPIKDIAVIKIRAQNLSTVILGDSNNSQVGDSVVVIGNPAGLENTVSDGLISGIRDRKEGYKWHQISAPISGGSSGSPIFNRKGEVIGIATASIIQGQNLNFSIPINYAIPLISDIPKMSLLDFSKITTEKLLKKMVSAIGAIETFDSIEDATITAISEDAGNTQRIIYYEKKNEFRMELETVGSGTIIVASDGRYFWWRQLPSGVPQDLPPEQLGQVKKISIFGSFMNPEKAGIKYNYLGKTTLKDKYFLELEARNTTDGDMSTFYIDPETYLVYMQRTMQQDTKGNKVENYIYSSDYRMINGLKIPFLRFDNNNNKMTIVSVSFNTGLSDSLFTKPIIR